MKNIKKQFFAKICAAFLAGSMFFSFPVFAEGEVSGEDRAAFVKNFVDYLSVYARYDDVTPSNLYKEGLLGVLEKHPELYEEIMHELLTSIDDHSEYYNTEEAQLFKENISGEVTGIGITFLMCDEGVDVRSVIADTPAARAGLQVGDIIVSADGTELAGMNSDTASGYIKGSEGTSVRIGIKRNGAENIIYVDLIREKIVGTSVTHEQFTDGEKELMYIKVYGFVSNTADCFGESLKIAQAAGITNLIIDLRDNGGGIFDQAIQMADMLVPKGSVITTEEQKVKILNRVYKAQLEDTENFNTVILINENSASASEVFAAALSENDSATLIGTNSYGKGTIQTVVDLIYGDTVKYTYGYYLTPKGNNINGVGIMPDMIVENSTTPFEIEKYPKFRFERVYRINDSGDEIKTAKEFLTAWGTYSGEINEIYDAELEDAVTDFQSYTGLYPYGVLDLTTQNELYNRMQMSKVVHDDQLDEAFSFFGMTREN